MLLSSALHALPPLPASGTPWKLWTTRAGVAWLAHETTDISLRRRRLSHRRYRRHRLSFGSLIGSFLGLYAMCFAGVFSCFFTKWSYYGRVEDGWGYSRGCTRASEEMFGRMLSRPPPPQRVATDPPDPPPLRSGISSSSIPRA